jgi:hypothetical protein
VALTTHPYLLPSLKEEWSYTSAPPLRFLGLLKGDLYLYLLYFIIIIDVSFHSGEEVLLKYTVRH